MTKSGPEAWLSAAFHALAEGGVDSLRVEPLAERLGVTKGSFYHHFADRRAFHEAVLQRWEAIGTQAVVEQVDLVRADPHARLRALMGVVLGAGAHVDAIELAVRGWAAADPVAASATARVDALRLSYTAGILREAGLPRRLAERRARLLYRLLIGEYVWRTTGGPASTTVEIDDMIALATAAP